MSAVFKLEKKGVRKTPRRISVKFILWRCLNMYLARDGKWCQIQRQDTPSNKCHLVFHLFVCLTGGYCHSNGNNSTLKHCNKWLVGVSTSMLNLCVYPRRVCCITTHVTQAIDLQMPPLDNNHVNHVCLTKKHPNTDIESDDETIAE